MGLWLKCPKCQTANPLDLKACAKCNASLENLPAAKRVYILDKTAPAALKAAPKAAAKKATPEGAATGSPSKGAKGTRSRKKKE